MEIKTFEWIIICMIIIVILYIIYKNVFYEYFTSDIDRLDNLMFNRADDIEEAEFAYLTINAKNHMSPYVYRFNFEGPKWNEQTFIECNEAETIRNKLLEPIKNFEFNKNIKTYPSFNNSTYCGGLGNSCRNSGDCCGNYNCKKGKCNY